MNNQGTISFGGNFTIAAGNSCTYKILLPYSNPPFSISDNNPIISWKTYLSGDVNEPSTVRANNLDSDQKPLNATPTINLTKNIFSDANCSISADTYQFEVGDTVCYEIEINNQANSNWYYPKGPLANLFDQVPASMPVLGCKFLS